MLQNSGWRTIAAKARLKGLTLQRAAVAGSFINKRGSRSPGQLTKGTLMNAVTVLTFNEPQEAEPIKSRLQQAGISAEIYDERKLQRYAFIAAPLAGIRVRVERGQYDRAKQLLQEWDQTEHALDHAVHCPSCGSSRIEYPQFTRKFLLPSIGVLLCRLGMLQAKFYCEECHFTWPVKEKIEPQRDELGWPKKP